MSSSLTIIAAAVLIAAGGAFGVLVRLLTRPPDNDPHSYLRQAKRDGTHCVVCFGDSLTHAAVSADYVRMLRERLGASGYVFVNAGVNSETTADLLRRLAAVVACRPDALALLIGTNDCRNGVDAAARGNLTDLLAQLSQRTTARLAVLSIPPIGEDLGSAINARVHAYNAMLRELADSSGVAYLPLYERLCARIESDARRPSPGEFSRPLVLRVGAQHYFFRKSWDEISERYELSVLTDFLHLNDRAASDAADLIEAWLIGPSGTMVAA